MIYSTLKPSYTRKLVKKCADEFIDNFYDIRVNGQLRSRDVVYVRNSDWPLGVTPIAIEASVSQGVDDRGRHICMKAVGVGLTQASAQAQARSKCREYLTKLAKKRKHVITIGHDGVTISQRDGACMRVLGYGTTLERALENVKDNIKMIEDLVDSEKFKERSTFINAVPEVPKKKWSFWDWFK